MATGSIKSIFARLLPVANGGTGANNSNDAADNLNTIKRYKINNGYAITTSVKRKISFSSDLFGIMYVAGGSSLNCGLYVFYGASSVVVMEPIKAASACSITTGTGFFTITSTSGSFYPVILSTLPLSRISETSA